MPLTEPLLYFEPLAPALLEVNVYTGSAAMSLVSASSRGGGAAKWATEGGVGGVNLVLLPVDSGLSTPKVDTKRNGDGLVGE